MIRKSSLFLITAVLGALILLGAGCRKKTESGGDQVKATEGPAAQATAISGTEAESKELGKGWLEVKGAGFEGHEVRNSQTGEKVGVIDSLTSTIELPAGSYEVVFGKMAWKGVEIKAGSNTTLEPGSLTVHHASLRGHDIVEADTGVVQGTVSVLKNTMTLIPGRYAVMFGKLSWPVEVQAGQTTIVNPGVVEVIHADISGHKIYDQAGDVVGEVSNIQSSIPLPPGDYEIDLGAKRVPFTLKEGDALKFER